MQTRRDWVFPVRLVRARIPNQRNKIHNHQVTGSTGACTNAAGAAAGRDDDGDSDGDDDDYGGAGPSKVPQSVTGGAGTSSAVSSPDTAAIAAVIRPFFGAFVFCISGLLRTTFRGHLRISTRNTANDVSKLHVGNPV